MSEENDRIAAASSREADELKRTFRSGNQATITAAYEAAKGRQARWIERSHKLTTLAAVFVTDCTPAIVREYPDDKRRLLASLVLNDADTLRQVHFIGGSLPRIAELLGPLSGLSEDEVAERIAAAERRA